MLGLKLNHVSKRGPCCVLALISSPLRLTYDCLNEFLNPTRSFPETKTHNTFPAVVSAAYVVYIYLRMTLLQSNGMPWKGTGVISRYGTGFGALLQNCWISKHGSECWCRYIFIRLALRKMQGVAIREICINSHGRISIYNIHSTCAVI